MTLTEFLLARIAEDEAAASRAGSFTPWSETFQNDNYGHLTIQPDRVRAECEAKRVIVDAHPLTTDVVPVDTRPSPGVGCETCHTVTAASVFDPDYVEAIGPCDTLLALAAVYADHPDYREEWRP